jgi:hypothetical protein
MQSANEAIRECALNPDYLVITGSRLYGTFREDSDIDYRGVFTPPWEYLTKLKDRDEVDIAKPASARRSNEPVSAETPDGDHKVYTFEAYIKYLLKQDPQMLELLFAPLDRVVKCNALGHDLRVNRTAFVCKNFYWRITGYSNSEWRKALGVKVVVPERTKTEDDVVMNIRNIFSPDKAVMDQVIELLFANHKKEQVSSLQGVSAKRKREFEQFGYTCSSACHSVRLMLQCAELLETGKMTFPRPEAPMLSDIKHGRLPLSRVVEEYEAAKAKCDAAFFVSDLPDAPDKKKIMSWLEHLVAKSLLSDKRLPVLAGQTGVI